MNSKMTLFRHLTATALLLIASVAHAATWHQATESELKTVIPARAPVISERIETEFRTASGIADTKGHIIAGVLLITAGYSANGKYSYFLLTQTPIKIADKTLAPGNYLIGWTRSDTELFVTISDAATGNPVVEVTAARNLEIHRVESFHIAPPGGMSVIQLGRFTFPYSLPEATR
ncbi:hypothetical protein HDF16_003932 [Granulicella aggregans]|uniref:Uncharacterized protein n=2 Tax=Granulicella aggregans TaxID=474949 RepID=A0A7W8E5E5_9BACT|nr:hypothetical protein [Granulicella aggregans]